MNNLLKIIIAILLTLMSFLTLANSDEITPKDASSLFNEKKAIIVDVREQDEWNAGHIKNALHMPLSEIDKHMDKLQAYKDQTIITQCRSGNRSMRALELLKAMGFKQVYSMAGGIQAWEQQGLNIEK